MTDRFGDWIITRTGRRFWPLDPHPEDVDLRDISHALCRLCRWTGQCHDHVSVSQHARYVASVVGMTHPRLRLAALHHDSAEAYLGDFSRPVKKSLLVDTSQAPSHVMTWLSYPSAPIAAVEEHLLQVIFEALKIPWPDSEGWKVIKFADDTVLMTEYRDQMTEPRDGTAFATTTVEPMSKRYFADDAFEAETMFLALHDHLVQKQSTYALE